MKNILKELLELIKNNKSILYSAVLIFSIPAILFASSYYSLGQFEKNFNHLIQTKGILIENVFVAGLSEEGDNLDKIQEKIYQIAIENQDVEELKIVEISDSEEGGKILASSNQNEIGEVSVDPKEFLAVGFAEGVAGIVSEDGMRFWEIVKKVQISKDQSAIIKVKLSLSEIDEAFQRSINRTYWAIILASLILILLVTNYVRLSRYVLMYNKIKEVDEMKDDFVSMASHELKTPLTAINGYLDLLDSAKKKLSKDEKHYLDNIQISSTRLKALVEDILEVSRIEQGRISFEYSQVSISEIVLRVIDSLSPKANEKKLKLFLTNQLAENEDSVKVDSKRFEQILINLIGNSIKYTQKGAIEIIISRKDHKIGIAIEDTGIGLSSSERENLFGKFTRIRNEQTSQIEGTGLGLWITKQLVEQMKGEISVESIKGKGSRFFLVFEEFKKK